MFSHTPRLGDAYTHRRTERRTTGWTSDNMKLNLNSEDVPVAQRHKNKLVNIMTNLSNVSSVKNNLAR